MIDWNIKRVLAALSRGGEIALAHYDAPSIRLKSDRSIVTEADHAIERVFGDLFDHPDTGAYLIGEETVDTKEPDYLHKAFNSVAWIVDPIDGTAPYAHHIPTWGISIARMENASITDGAIFLPVSGEVFITDGDDILYGSLEELSPLSIVKSGLSQSGMIALTQSMAKRGTFGADNPVQSLACAVFPLTYLLLGRYLGYIGTLKLWDVAGALAMLTRAGFPCVLMNGNPVGCAVTDSVYHLDADSPHRWFLHDSMVCGPSQEVVDFLLEIASAN